MVFSLTNHIDADDLIVARLGQWEILSPRLVHNIKSEKRVLTLEKLVEQAIQMLAELLAHFLAERFEVGHVQLPNFRDAEIRMWRKAKHAALLHLRGLGWSQRVELLPIGKVERLCELAGIKRDVVVSPGRILVANPECRCFQSRRNPLGDKIVKSATMDDRRPLLAAILKRVKSWRVEIAVGQLLSRHILLPVLGLEFASECAGGLLHVGSNEHRAERVRQAHRTLESAPRCDGCLGFLWFGHNGERRVLRGLTTQAQRRRPRDASIATVMRCRRSLQRMVRPTTFHITRLSSVLDQSCAPTTRRCE